ncbi:Exo_endo_phos domain-containing protein, partial [Cephalotus follicularis]
IYGMCDSRARKQLWNDIILCANRFKKTPWTLLGDFNVTRFSHEHNNSCRVTKAMEDFNYAIRSAKLDDLKSTGLKFTWNNMRSGTGAISKKLDRALGNWQWFKLFGDSYAHTYNPGISDHCPLFIQLMHQVQSSGRPLKFLNFWADHSDFLNIVRHEWAKTYKGQPVRKIQLKLKSLKLHLKTLSTRPDMSATNLRQMLEKVQLDLDEKPEDVDLRRQEIRLRNDVTISAKNGEAFFKQKSLIHWLKQGDSNTAFFHRVVKLRQSKNHIAKIQNEHGLWLESEQFIAQEGVDYFKNLFHHQGGQLH